MEAARAAVQALAALAFSAVDTSVMAVEGPLFPVDALHCSSQPNDAGCRLASQAEAVRD